jgi:8-oxo-dGTP pyrophosphatase MutT (NUDIX family)
MVIAQSENCWNVVQYNKHHLDGRKQFDFCENKIMEEIYPKQWQSHRETVVNDVKSYYRQLREEKKAIKKTYEDSNNNLVIEVGDSIFVYPKKAGIILFNTEKDKVLLVCSKHFENGELIWSLPKGHLEDGETNWQTAKRETYEETGLNIDILEQDPSVKLNNTVFYSYIGNSTEIETITNGYITDEIVECKFIPIEDIRKTKVTKETLIMCTKKVKLCQKIAKPLL